MIDPTNFITRTPLEDLAFQFVNAATDFVGTDVLPVKPITAVQKKVYQYDSSMLRRVQTKQSSRGQAGKVDYGVFTANITTDLYKLAADIDPKDEVTFDQPVNAVRRNQAKNVMQRLLLDHELSVASLVMTNTNYPSDLTSALTTNTNRWIDAGGDFEADQVTAENAIRNRCGKGHNAAVLAGDSVRKLRTSATFRERVKYTTSFQSEDMFIETLKTALGVDYLFVAQAKYNNSNQGATDSITNIWTNSIAFFYYNPSPALEDISFGHTYMRKQLYSFEAIDPKRGGPDGRITELEMGWEWVIAPGFVPDSSNTTKFAAGYLLENIV
jgi:hypothetical protein